MLRVKAEMEHNSWTCRGPDCSRTGVHCEAHGQQARDQLTFVLVLGGDSDDSVLHILVLVDFSLVERLAEALWLHSWSQAAIREMQPVLRFSEKMHDMILGASILTILPIWSTNEAKDAFEQISKSLHSLGVRQLMRLQNLL
ncbi:uncharacterized protein LOC144096765 [Amblyomma americanum]